MKNKSVEFKNVLKMASLNSTSSQFLNKVVR